MAGKESVLEPYGKSIRSWLAKGKALSYIQEQLLERYKLEITRQAIGQFVEKKGWKKAEVAKKDVSPPLFASWYQLGQLAGKSATDMVEELNAACGTRYKPNFIYSLQSGDKGLERTPSTVRNYMLASVLGAKLLALGVPEKSVKELILAVSI